MLVTAKFSILGLTKGKKYLVAGDSDFEKGLYKVRLDNGELAIRNKNIFEEKKYN